MGLGGIQGVLGWVLATVAFGSALVAVLVNMWIAQESGSATAGLWKYCATSSSCELLESAGVKPAASWEAVRAFSVFAGVASGMGWLFATFGLTRNSPRLVETGAWGLGWASVCALVAAIVFGILYTETFPGPASYAFSFGLAFECVAIGTALLACWSLYHLARSQ
jgi:hypothetical protein